MCKIAVFAGTREGRELLSALAGRGAALTAFVATEYGEIVLGDLPDTEIRSGALLREDMPGVFREEDFDLVIDATHPYAQRITESISLSCAETGTPYLRLLRPSGAAEEDGVFVEDTAACVAFLKGTEGNVLLTTGVRSLPEYAAEESLRGRLYARVLPAESSLQICRECGLAPDHIIAMQGPFSEELNTALLRSVRAAYLVTKDTGGPGGYAEKIRAARAAGANAVIIGRPGEVPGLPTAEVLAEVERRFRLAPMRKKVILAGIGTGSEDSRTLGVLRAVREADVLIGARRMLESVDTAGKKIFAAVASAEIAGIIRREPGHVFTVLFSGDTGFYSGAKSLRKALEGEDTEVETLPGIGSLSYLCAKLGRPWEDVRAMSLHGREQDLVSEVRENAAVFTLLGGETGAADALARLSRAGLGGLKAHIGEDLGYETERITSGTVDGLLEGRYSSLSVLLVENPRADSEPVTYGLADSAFERDRVPMTKEEVRAVCLSKLALSRGAVVYDVGSGSGSVSVECARIARRGRVYAIEQKEEAAALTARNAEKFGLTNLMLVTGRAPEALLPLEPPTHAFIGGSAGNLREIVRVLLDKNPDVRIVATAVTLETLAELTELTGEFEFSDVAEIQVNKPRKVGRYHLSDAQNPVYVFTFRHPKDRDEG